MEMKAKRSVSAYRNIDLAFFAGILVLCETLILKAAGTWFRDQLYTVSICGALTAIVYMRWGIWGMLHAALGGAITCLVLGGGPEQYLIYCGGNLLSAIVLMVRKLAGPGRIRNNALASMGFGLLTLLLMQSGRALVSLILGYGFENATGFYATDALSLVFTAVVIWVARRLDGIFEDQRSYLVRINEEERKA